MMEIEVKIEVKDFSPFEKILSKEIFDEIRDWVFEDNLVFDVEDLKLKKEGKLLRLRKTGENIILTFKNKVEKKYSEYKVREEIEIKVSDFENTIKILKGLGYKVFFRYQKFRKIYSRSSNHVCLDKTPIGNFIEIEGDENFILKMAEKLGFTKKAFLKETYYELFLKKRKNGESFMLFDKSVYSSPR